MPSHWSAGAVAQTLASQLSLDACAGQPVGSATVVSQGVLVDLTLQKRSVE
jgi:hypothetical protein